MDLDKINPECRSHLEQLGFAFIKSHGVWANRKLGKERTISYEEVRDHDLAWLKYRIAELAVT